MSPATQKPPDSLPCAVEMFTIIDGPALFDPAWEQHRRVWIPETTRVLRFIVQINSQALCVDYRADHELQELRFIEYTKLRPR